MNKYLQAAKQLHTYLVNHHWNGKTLIGPMPIGKINWRVTRFIKSYLDWVPWGDNYAYMQAQGYWIQSNLLLTEMTGKVQYSSIARACADYIAGQQLPNGAWQYPPLRERRHHLSSIEGAWASLGLIKAFQKFGEQKYLDAIVKWHHFQTREIGFQKHKDSLAINFLYRLSNSRVPNASTMLLWLLAELHKTTGNRIFIEHKDQLLRFIEYSQMENGELQYSFGGKPHFQCYQYNSFEFLDLASHYEITQDEQTWRILKKMANFLVTGVTESGACRYNCFKVYPETNYWTAVLAAALYKADKLGLGQYRKDSERAYRRLLNQQNKDGGYGFSRKNYRFLSDQRSYPQQLAMILKMLLVRVEHKGIKEV